MPKVKETSSEQVQKMKLSVKVSKAHAFPVFSDLTSSRFLLSVFPSSMSYFSLASGTFLSVEEPGVSSQKATEESSDMV